MLQAGEVAGSISNELIAFSSMYLILSAADVNFETVAETSMKITGFWDLDLF
jgi:hypothetical protein